MKGIPGTCVIKTDDHCYKKGWTSLFSVNYGEENTYFEAR